MRAVPIDLPPAMGVLVTPGTVCSAGDSTIGFIWDRAPRGKLGMLVGLAVSNHASIFLGGRCLLCSHQLKYKWKGGVRKREGLCSVPTAQYFYSD